MKVNLSRDEIDAIRNALATRRGDLNDIIWEDATDESRQEAEAEMVAVTSADEKLVAALQRS